MRAYLSSLVLLLLFGAAGCDCSGEPEFLGAACPGLTGCGTRCGAGMTACRAGLYCGADLTCTADCSTSPSVACPAGYMCQSNGHCVLADAGGLVRPDGRVDGSLVCADVTVDTRRQTPTVVLLVDQSGSMTESFGSGNRWTVLRSSLLADPTGLIFDLQDQVRFGLTLYSGREGDPVCPLLTTVAPALNNYGGIATVYNMADPIADTPTGDSIDAVVAELRSIPDPPPDPTIIVLATDGEPDRCEELNPQNGQAEAIAAAQASFRAGYRLYIISVGEGTVSASHLQDMANAGIGAPAGASSPFWVAGDDMGLRDALRAIVGGEVSCLVELSGMIDLTMTCTGVVRLNGRILTCDDPNGWRAVDATHIELQGSACTELTSGPGNTLTATFPCNVVVF